MHLQLEARRRELGVTDVQISLTSLEEVFLNIARKVGRPTEIVFIMRIGAWQWAHGHGLGLISGGQQSGWG